MKASCVPILGIPGHVIVNWDTRNIKKNGNFWLERLLNPYNSKTTWRAQLKFGHNVDALRKPSLGAPSHVTKIYWPKMGKKWMILNRCISVITDMNEKWFVIFEHTINCFSFRYVGLPQLEYYFSFFLFLTFFLFSYSFPAIYFWTAKRIVFKVWAIKDIRED